MVEWELLECLRRGDEWEFEAVLDFERHAEQSEDERPKSGIAGI
jgi:hypothetical protein